MSNIPDPPTPVNAPPRSTADPATTIEDLRNQALAAWALIEALNDALESLPPGTIDERLLMLATVCEDKSCEVFSGASALAQKPL